MDAMSEDVWDEEQPDDELEEGAAEPVERLRLVIERKQESMRIDKFLMMRIERVTRNKIQQAIDDGMILVNNAPTKANYKIRPKDEIVVYDTRRAARCPASECARRRPLFRPPAQSPAIRYSRLRQ